MRPRTTLLILSLAGLAATALTGCGSSSTAVPGPEGVTGHYILSLCDADMQASALVDRQLGPRSGEQDKVTIIGLPLAKSNEDKYETPFAQVPVSNSVMGPPQAVAVTADGKRAYVIENQGPAPDGATTIDDLPDGNKLTAIDLSNPFSPVVSAVVEVGKNPTAVDVSPDGSFLCVVSQERRRQLQLIPVSGTGELGQAVDFPLIGMDNDESTLPSCVSWHPSGNFLAVTVPASNQVIFYRVSRDGSGIGLVPWGSPVVVGKYPYSGKFTLDGKYYITTDMQWGEDVPGVFVEPPQGQLTVVRFDGTAGGKHEVVAAAPVGVNPEGLALSPDGSLVVTANLLRSFLPDADPRLTRGGSLSLLKLGADGVLTPVEEYPIESMPVGLAFDAKGNYVVVTQFRSFDPSVVTGELAFFMVRKGEKPSLEKADFYVGVGRGPHGVLIVR